MMRLSRSRPTPSGLLLFNGGGSLFGFGGTCHFFCAAHTWIDLVFMLGELPGCDAAALDHVRKFWHCGTWGVIANGLPREVGVWVQPSKGETVQRLYPKPVVKRITRTR